MRLSIRIINILIISFLPWHFLNAQNSQTTGENKIAEILENLVSSSDETIDPTVLSDDLYYFLEHPLNINSANENEFRQLHLLTEFQIYSLLNYISENGAFLSIYELRLVYGFDEEVINSLMPFICLSTDSNSSKKQDSRYIKLRNSLALRTGFDPIIKKGFVPDSNGISAFQGSNRPIMIRYLGELDRFKIGCTIDQDAGESFRVENKKFKPDFFSGFLEYKGKKYLKSIVIGDYKTSWGQGLILGNFGNRKSSEVLLKPQSTGLKKYSSAGETDFFRGAAVKFEFSDIEMELFSSTLSNDGSLHFPENDSLASPYFNSLEASGLHRSLNEIAKKDVILIKSFGGHAQIRKTNYVVGFSYLNQKYNYDWVRNSTAYTEEFYSKSSSIQNISSDYKISLGKLAIFGEIAFDTKGRMALFNGILAELHPLIRLSMAYRKYQPDYLGINASGFGESQSTKNEEGYYLGLQLYPWKYMKIDLYADHYSFPFLRYNSTNPYSGNDYLLNLNFYLSKEFGLNMRLKYEKTQNRSSECITGVDRMETAKKGYYRIELKYAFNKNINLKSRFEFSYYKTGVQKMTQGFYSGHDINFQTPSGKYRLFMRYAIFDIPSWENRIYAYENDVLYSFSVPAFNSQGTRFICMTKIDIFPFLELSLRYSLSGFPGIRTIGNSYDEVKTNHDSYYTIQMRFRI